MNQQVTLLPATKSNCQLVYDWANDPEVRKASFSSEPIPWKDHCSWYETMLRSDSCVMSLIQDEQLRFVGVVRMSLDGTKARVSLTIAPERRGNGYGVSALRLSCQNVFKKHGIESVDAFIKKNNAASIRCFIKAGFVGGKDAEVSGHPCLRFTRDKTRSEG